MLNLKNRRTKIICTIGPATESREALAKLIDAGMNVARINFSHGTHATHARVVKRIRDIAAKKEIPVAILQDLSGPKIRIGEMAQPVELRAGSSFSLYLDSFPGDKTGVSTSNPDVVNAVEPGDKILLADGTIVLEVRKKSADRVQCRVLVGGMLSSHKGINLPSRSLPIPSLTEKDKKDLAFGIKLGVDFVALSFVRRPEDVVEVRHLIEQAGADIPVISKIEKHEAIASIDTIIAYSDGIMVARGDLAVETALETVPLVQKKIIEKCNENGKPVITATQMLRSMVDNPHPTRAEAADVANAVLDGTDAVMLSEETAIGSYPVATVETMHRIIIEAEKELEAHWHLKVQQKDGEVTVPAAVSHAAVSMARDLDATAIVTPTRSGSTARMVARFRPRRPVVAVCTEPAVQHRLCLVWGVFPYLEREARNSDDILGLALSVAKEHGFARKGQRIVLTAGLPPGQSGSTNLIKVEEVG